MHILLADDSKVAAETTKAFLTNLGHRVTCVHDGLQACEAFQRERPDLVLLDVIMPVMDGFEATRKIKHLSANDWTPVILMTGLSSIEEVVTGFEAGADDYLVKPFDSKILAARIEVMQRIATIHDSLRGVLDNVSEAIITIDEKGIVETFNQAAQRIFGYLPEQIIGQNVKKLMPSPYTEGHDGYLARYMQDRVPHVIGTGRKVQGLRSTGEVFPMRLAVTEVKRKERSIFIGLVADITQEEAARKRIEFLALHDALTGLPNRTQFTEAVKLTLESAPQQKHAVLFIDLDGFKPINDKLGHDMGDRALKKVAARLLRTLGPNDMVARLGGDEFVVLARNVRDTAAVEQLGQSLIQALSEPMLLKMQLTQMGASVGIALFPEHGQTVSDILTAADHAMYDAKHSGKGCLRLAAQQSS